MIIFKLNSDLWSRRNSSATTTSLIKRKAQNWPYSLKRNGLNLRSIRWMLSMLVLLSFGLRIRPNFIRNTRNNTFQWFSICKRTLLTSMRNISSNTGPANILIKIIKYHLEAKVSIKSWKMSWVSLAAILRISLISIVIYWRVSIMRLWLISPLKTRNLSDDLGQIFSL